MIYSAAVVGKFTVHNKIYLYQFNITTGTT
jgi:hypothetical protein